MKKTIKKVSAEMKAELGRMKERNNGEKVKIRYPKLPPNWGKVNTTPDRYSDSESILGTELPDSKVTWPPDTKESRSFPELRAFPVKSFDSVLQPIVDVCIDEIENILKVWTRTR